MEIKSLKNYHKNPRKITEKMFSLLGDSIKEYGDLSGIVVNVRTGEIIGGNQRTQFFKDSGDKAEVVKTPVENSKVGTVAVGYVLYEGEKYSYREVDWDEKKSELANIMANKVTGFWDNDILANQFDVEDLKLAGFEDFELGMFNEEIELDDSKDLTKTMDSYLDGSIKQIVLYFKNEDYETLIPRLEKLAEEMGVENYSDLFIKLLDSYENNSGN